MNRKLRMYLSSAFVAALLVAPYAGAQQKQAAAPLTYDLNREVVLQGTVVLFTAASTVPPIGAHVSIQTASGVVDVHLGNADFMKANDVFLNPGDSVKIAGQNRPFGSGSVFVARVLQKGTQTVTLRNLNGVPYTAKAAANAKPRSLQGGAQ